MIFYKRLLACAGGANLFFCAAIVSAQMDLESADLCAAPAEKSQCVSAEDAAACGLLSIQAQLYSGSCVQGLEAINAQVSDLRAAGYEPVGAPQRAVSNENCALAGLWPSDELGCLTLLTQVFYNEREDQSLLLCVSHDAGATNIAIWCGGGGGLNIAPLAAGRFILSDAMGSDAEVITTVRSSDLDGPLRQVTLVDRLDPRP